MNDNMIYCFVDVPDNWSWKLINYKCQRQQYIVKNFQTNYVFFNRIKYGNNLNTHYFKYYDCKQSFFKNLWKLQGIEIWVVVL